MNGFIGANMQILGAWCLLQGVEAGDLSVFFRFPAPNGFGLAVFGSFFKSLVPPRSRDDVINVVIGFAEIEWDSGKLGGGAALKEEDGVFGWYVEKGSEI